MTSIVLLSILGETPSLVTLLVKAEGQRMSHLVQTVKPYETKNVILEYELYKCTRDNMYYRQDLVPLLESPIQRRGSLFFYFGHIYSIVIHNILLVHTSNYVEAQTLKKEDVQSESALRAQYVAPTGNLSMYSE